MHEATKQMGCKCKVCSIKAITYYISHYVVCETEWCWAVFK